mgnify:CR=1 FL=1
MPLRAVVCDRGASASSSWAGLIALVLTAGVRYTVRLLNDQRLRPSPEAGTGDETLERLHGLHDRLPLPMDAETMDA